ncbi:MAG: hypothetical protein JWO69_798 [Thermoleophilia bacterium]|jgi:hypothetical protein|nr:hypothetical protein [Thermoleophilia bacterium]
MGWSTRGRHTIVAAILALAAFSSSAQAASLPFQRATPGVPVTGCPTFTYADGSSTNGVLHAGDSTACDVSLTSAPREDVTLTFSSNQDRLTFTPASITFSPSAWNVPQRVTITAKADEWQDPLRSYVAIEVSVGAPTGCGSTWFDDSSWSNGTSVPASEFATRWSKLVNKHANQTPRVEPPVSSVQCKPNDLTPYPRHALRIGVVQIVEPQNAAFEVSTASTLTDREGGGTTS